jgi:AraC-like DNA-binding protein
MVAWASAPVFLSPRITCFWAAPTLRVIVIVGNPDVEDGRSLGHAIDRAMSKGGRRYSSLIDVRGLGLLRDDCLSRFLSDVTADTDLIARRVERSAIVHRDNAAALAVAGYLRILGDPFPCRAFHALESALRWLEFPALVDDVSASLASISARENALLRLRTVLSQSPRAPLASCSATLGVSTRSLQRQLKDAGTSFRAEVARACVNVAKEQLVTTDDKIFKIALDLGLKSTKSLVRTFREATGRAPSQWREAARQGESSSIHHRSSSSQGSS